MAPKPPALDTAATSAGGGEKKVQLRKVDYPDTAQWVDAMQQLVQENSI